MCETLTAGDNSPSLCLDYYEMIFAVMKKTRSDASEEGWINKTFLHTEANFSRWDHQVVTKYSRPAQGPESVSFCHYYSGIILDSFASLLCSK